MTAPEMSPQCRYRAESRQGRSIEGVTEMPSQLIARLYREHARWAEITDSTGKIIGGIHRQMPGVNRRMYWTNS